MTLTPPHPQYQNTQREHPETVGTLGVWLGDNGVRRINKETFPSQEQGLASGPRSRCAVGFCYFGFWPWKPLQNMGAANPLLLERLDLPQGFQATLPGPCYPFLNLQVLLSQFSSTPATMFDTVELVGDPHLHPGLHCLFLPF